MILSAKSPSVGVLCLSNSLGGLELNTINLANWFQERGWKITMFLLQNSPMAKRAHQLSIPVTYTNKKWKYFDLMNAFKLSKQINESKIDFLVVTNNHDISISSVVKNIWNNNVKVIYHQEMQIGVSKKDFLHTIRYSAIDAWVSPLKWLANEVIEKTKFNKKKIHIIPLGAELDRFSKNKITKEAARKELNLNIKGKLLGVLGRIDPMKQQEVVIKALSKLEGVELLIMGEPTVGEGGNYLTHLKKLVKDLNIEDRVHFRGFSDRTEVFYKSLDIFIMPSLKETYGMVTIEAMGSGVPIIGTDTGGTPEILKQGELGLLFPPENEHILAEQISRYLENPLEMEHKSNLAQQEAITKYSHTNQCDSMEELMMGMI